MELIKEKRVTSKEWWSWICDGVPLRFFVFKCLLSVWCRRAPLALFPHLIGHAIWRSGLWCLVYDGCCASISLTLYYFTHDIRIINIISITLSVCCAYKNSLRKEKETETKIKIRMKIKKNVRQERTDRWTDNILWLSLGTVIYHLIYVLFIFSSEFILASNNWKIQNKRNLFFTGIYRTHNFKL